MKKYLSMILALVMVFALAIPVFADDVNTEGSASQGVTAGYVEAEDKNEGTIYRVTIDWKASTDAEPLTYTGEQATYKWDTDGLKYDKTIDKAAGWYGSTGYSVTVTNYSNAAVNVGLDATNQYGLELTKSGSDSAELGSAAVSNGQTIEFNDTTKTGEAQSATYTYTYAAKDGATVPTNVENATITIGTITVTVTGK